MTPDLTDPTDPEEVAQAILVRELDLARRDFCHFLDFVKVEEPPPGRGAIPFERWEHLERLNQALSSHRLVQVLKSRQVGASWDLAAYFLWSASFAPHAHLGMWSRNEADAEELIRKQKFIYQRLPPQLQLPVKSLANPLELVFTGSDSWIRAFPSTEHAGRGYTFSKVWFDEFDFHPYATQSYTSVKPALDDLGGQVIITSTANYRLLSSEFKAIYANAPANGFRTFFFGWSVRPNRDEDWYLQRRAEYRDEHQFEKEYPYSEEEALAPPQTLAAFHLEALDQMKLDCRPPIDTNGVYNIYRHYQVGRRYAAGTDTSHGVGLDQSVTVVREVDTGYVVADLQNANLSPEELALHSVELLARYRNPIWGIEDNDWGVNTIARAEQLGYPRLFRAELRGVRSGRSARGWHTDAVSRFNLWGDLQAAVNSRALTIPNAQGLAQFYQIIRNPEKNGRLEAVAGAHDDYPMAVGITIQIAPWAARLSRSLAREDGPPGTGEVASSLRRRGRGTWSAGFR